MVEAKLVLAQMGEHTLITIISGNESVGTVMRKRLLPLTTPLGKKSGFIFGLTFPKQALKSLYRALKLSVF